MIAEALAWMTPERRAALEALTHEEIAAQIASDPDVSPEADEAWFARAKWSSTGPDGQRIAYGRESSDRAAAYL